MKRFFLIVFFVPTLAFSAAYQNAALSASDLGSADAGSGSAIENASAQAFNPASLSRLKGMHLSLGWVGVSENLKFNKQQNGGTWRNLPHIYWSAPLDDDLTLGLAYNHQASWKNHYPASWQAQNWLIHSQMQIENFNSNLAWRAHEKWRVGLGFSFARLKWQWKNASFAQKNQKNAWGWQAGILLTPSDSMNVSLSYQSPIWFKEQNWHFKTPPRFAISTWQQLNKQWELMASVSWTKWKNNANLWIDEPSLLAQPIISTGSALRFAWGTAYAFSPSLKFKWGIAYDISPLKATERTPALPHHNQWWLSTGLRWKVQNKAYVDLAYSYVYESRSDVHLPKLGLSGSYYNRAHWWGMQYSIHF